MPVSVYCAAYVPRMSWTRRSSPTTPSPAWRGDLVGGVDEVVPGPVAGGNVHTGGLEDRRVDENADGVSAGGQAVELAIDDRVGEREVGVLVGREFLLDRGQVEERAGGAVLLRLGATEGEHVGSGARREVGGEPVEEIVGGADRLLDHRDVRVLLFELVDDLRHDGGPLVVAPPGDVEFDLLVRVEPAGGAASPPPPPAQPARASVATTVCRGQPGPRWNVLNASLRLASFRECDSRRNRFHGK